MTDKAVEVELVKHPQHYNEHPSGVECIDVIEHFPHNIGAAVKYLWRAGLKPGEGSERDLNKALWYVSREILRRGHEYKPSGYEDLVSRGSYISDRRADRREKDPG